MTLKNWVAAGAKCFAEINGQKIPAIILETGFSSAGDYEQARLRIAVPNPMSGGYLVSDYHKPVQSYKLTRRFTTIPALDQPGPGPEKAA
jgi:hypothetical protein